METQGDDGGREDRMLNLLLALQQRAEEQAQAQCELRDSVEKQAQAQCEIRDGVEKQAQAQIQTLSQHLDQWAQKLNEWRGEIRAVKKETEQYVREQCETLSETVSRQLQAVEISSENRV